VEARYEEILRYVRFGPADRERLASVRPLVAPHLARIAAEFYDRIREHDDAHAVFRDEAQVDRLTRSMEAWLDQVFVGAYDAAFFERNARVGRVHVEVGLPQRYVLTAMNVIRASLTAVLAEGGATEDARSSLAKALDAQLAVMLDAHADKIAERIQAIDRQPGPLVPPAHRVEQDYASLLELAQLMVVGADARGVIVLANDEIARATGFGRDELIGRRIAELLAAGSDAEPLEAAWRTVAEGARTDAEVEVELATRSGRRPTVHLLLARPDRSSARPSGALVLALGRDVTEERALAERTRQSERLAAVGTLAAGLAHEIRNPLNGAHLAVTFLDRALRREGMNGEAAEAVKTIEHEISRLSALVTEFLQFARPQPIVSAEVSLSALSSRVSTLLAGDARAAGVVLAVDLPTTDVVVDADADKLEQVVLNLGRNAIEAIRDAKRGGRVVLRLRRTPRRALIEVKDDGPGLSSETAPIFDAFFSTKPAGTGLGLSIAHRIVTDHGGQIDVESTPDGTTFSVSLPLREPATDAHRKTKRPT
jgi:PAS domain S-box-containing protein